MTEKRGGPSAEMRRRSKKDREKRLRVLKMKRAALLAAMFLILVIIIMLIRAAFTNLRPKADQTTLTIKSDGSVRLEELVDMQAFDVSRGDVKSEVKSEIKEFNKKNKSGKVKLVRIGSKDKMIYLETTYKNVETYMAFTGYDMYFGSVKKAEAAGIDFNAVFKKVKDQKIGAEISPDKVKKMEGKLLTINENIAVRVPGTISAVSGDNVKILDKSTAEIKSVDGNEDLAAVTYIIYK